MKRQLADRARQAEALEKQLQLEKQELEFLQGGHDHNNDVADVVTNAKEFQIDRKSRTIQFPPSTDPIQSTADITGVSGIVGNHVPTTPQAGTTAGLNQNIEGTATSVSSSTTSSTSSGVIKRETPSSLQDAVGNELHPSSPSISKDELQLQRPTKIPRLNDNQSRNHGSPLNHNIHQTEQKSSIASSSSTNVAALTTTNSVGPLQAQSSSRRLSLDPQQLATSSEAMANSHANHDDSASSQQSAFYLKHQNRALATELKSYQYSISELLQERTIRRSHCYRIFQNVQQLVNIWNAIENTLVSTSESTVGGERIDTHTDTDANTKNNNNSVPLGIDDAVASTGSDDSVEWTRALHKALITLGRCNQNESGGSVVKELSSSSNLPSDNNDSSNDYHYTEEIVANISARAKILQDWLQKILEKQRSNDNDVVMDEKGDCDELSVVEQQRKEISELLTRCATLESQITELVTCRSDLIQRERRLRRNIYRMASDLLSPEQVVNSAILRPDEVTSDYSNEYDDIETSVQLEKQELLRLQKEHQELINATKSLQMSRTSGQGDSVVADATNTYSETPQISHLLSNQLAEYQIKVTQLEESVAIANESIHQLNDILKEKENELTLLSQRQISDDDKFALESIPSTLLQLSQSQQRNVELQKRLSTTEDMWAESLSNEKAAMQSVSDLVQKFNKRWVELTSTAFTDHHDSPSDAGSTTESAILSTSTDDVIHEHPHIRMSKQIHELQFKLQQAMENVRQADLSRENLKTALAMNTTLQSKLDDLKVKYTALQSARTTGTALKGSSSTKHTSTTDNDIKHGVSTKVDDNVLHEASANDNVNSSNTVSQPDAISTSTSRKEKPDSSKSQNADSNTTSSSTNRTSTSASSSEKLHRDYRKVRKDLAAKTADHAAMMTTNVRLMKQITEKDEMNAKSLSTILHLKSTTEKLVEERDHLETQMKNASQLALAARLATNAKDRVSEELLREKNSLDLRRIDLEEQLRNTEAELNRISIEWANASSSISSKDTELANVRQRCNQLVEENEHHREEARNLKNALRQAEREVRDKNERLAEIMAQASKDGSLNAISSDAVSSSSSFTVEQLQTQVSVLKNRLACPVCHYRDKECIIIRCRHMHCKQCVDERVSNRSRKCPTCNVKFAENEVETIFLS